MSSADREPMKSTAPQGVADGGSFALMNGGDVRGTIWDAKDGCRSIRIRRDYTHLGVRQFDVINLETRRETRITAAGLLRKFVQRGSAAWLATRSGASTRREE